MIQFLKKDEIEKEIKEILRLSYLPLTSTDIYEFIQERLGKEINKNTFNKVLRDLSNQEFILKKSIPGKRDNIYSTKEREHKKKYIEIFIIGKYVNFSSEYSEDNQNNKEIIKKELLQAIGLIDYFDIRKFCGIHQYDPRFPNLMTLQRPREIDWVRELEKYLDNPDTTMLTTAIIYFDEKDIELEKLATLGDLKMYKIKIPYGGPVFDEYKIGWILDGQQRMWATDFIAIKKGSQYYHLIAPVSIVIGNFNEEEDEKKRKILRKIFLVANNTKGFKKNLLKSLSTYLDPYILENVRQEFSIHATYEKMARQLNNDIDSPFRNLIDIGNIKKVRKDTKLITLGNMIECIKIIIEENDLIFQKGYFSEDDWNYKNILARIKDYFNTIKIIWKDSWEKEYDKCRIRAPVVLFAFSYLIKDFISLNVKDKSRAEFIKELYIPNLLKIKEETYFEISDPYIANLRNSKKAAIDLKKNLVRWIKSNSNTYNDIEIESIFENIRNLYPEGSPSRLET
ncbi:MAG: DGQHR domain-containing protein [Candidatus Helarchaeota archaeon]